MEREKKESPVAQEEMDDDVVRLLGLFSSGPSSPGIVVVQIVH
jgi:hypothetical protein